MNYVSHPYFWFAIAALLFILAIYFLSDTIKFSSYVPRKQLLTNAELNFYGQLVKAVNGKAHIFCMVRVADVVTIKNSIKGRRRLQKLGPIAQKHFDFVLVDNQTNILCAIELNDSSHDKKDRKERDEFLTKVMESTGTPLLWIQAAARYDIDAIRKYLNAHLPVYFPHNPNKPNA
jgi:hypothetical protein